MSYQALARKWRPKIFEEVIGQEHVVSALTNALDNQRVHHAFLFTGTRGVGKTTLARIFAKALNCEQGVSSTPCGNCVACRGVDQGNFVDLIEVDAASRTKVDDTRELLDNVQYTPTQGRFKIYLIDEVHMLSTHSFNALLKTLEEPPEHVKFLLATTDPQKLPTTILSRCIQFNLKAMDTGRLTTQLEKILEAEGIEYDQGAMLILARSANGSVRDALSLLDQGIAFGNGEVRTDQVRTMLGMIDEQFTRQILTQVCRQQGAAALDTVSEMALRSVDFGSALDEILTTLHNISLYQVNPQAVEWKGIDSSTLGELSELADPELLQLLYQIALIGKRDLVLASDPRSGFEMVLLRMIAFQPARPDAPRTDGDRSKSSPLKSDTVNAEPTDEPTTMTVARISEESIPSPVNTDTHPEVRKSADPDAVTTVDKTSADDTQRDDAEPGAITRQQDTDWQALVNNGGWARYIADCGLNGMSREMVMNMVAESVDGNVINLTLDAEYRHLLNDSRLRKIEKHLQDRQSAPLKLNVTVGEVDGQLRETPSQQSHRANREKQQAARQAFSHDPNVQELVDLFDAEIVNDSITPPSSQ